MKTRTILFLFLFWLAPLFAQQQPSAPRELYRIHFFKAAPGKLPDLLEAYRTAPVPDNVTPRPMVFHHQAGNDWDVMVIYPLGAKASLDANPPPLPEAIRKFRERVMSDYAWHTDTYASGPPLFEVQKALAVPQGAEGSGGLYLVTDYMAIAGHYAAFNDLLKREMAAARSAGSVRFDHVQGDSWDFLVMYRYASWEEYAAAESDPQADDAARRQGFADAADIGLQLRQHMSAHHDNFVSRVQ